MRRPVSNLFAICVLVCVSTASRADDLTIRAAFDSKTSVTSNEKNELSLSRALQPADGSLAVLIGDTDVTGMLIMEAANVSYTPRLPLAVGECNVTVWLVSAGNQWKEIARFPLRVAAVGICPARLALLRRRFREPGRSAARVDFARRGRDSR
jgi:hypothetical protein